MIKIAIDGPSGAGKSSLAKALAARLQFIYVDTGALYRAIGLYVCRRGVDPRSAEEVTALLTEIRVEMQHVDGCQHVFLNGEDVSTAIREHKISAYASDVSAIPAVRAFLLDLQRGMADRCNVIMDGRDIGTVIFPDAEVKLFLTASAETRARRRCAELAEKGQTVDYDQVLRDIVARDRNDSTRAVAPAIQAPDAILLDNSEMSFEQTVEAALAIITANLG